MQVTEKLPSGIRLLRGPKRSYAVTVSVIDACYSKNGGCDHCKYNTECKQMFDKRCDEWQPRKERSKVVYRREQTKEQQYCTWIPVLSSSTLRYANQLRRESLLC